MDDIQKIKDIVADHEKRILHLENSLTRKYPDMGTPSRDNEPRIKVDVEQGMSELAKNCNLTLEELKNVISIKNYKVEMISPINIKNEAEKQSIATQCILIAYEIALKNEWTKTPELKEALRAMGIQDSSGHLASNLKRRTELFRNRGKNIGAEYKLTTGGRTYAYEIIRKLARNESLG